MRVKFVVSHGGEFISLVSVEIGIFLIESEMLVFAKNVPKPKANVKPSAECHRENSKKNIPIVRQGSVTNITIFHVTYTIEPFHNLIFS